MPDIHIESARPLYLELSARGHRIGEATGFVASLGDKHFLVTNWHVLSGRHAATHELLSPSTGAVPDSVTIHHNALSGLGHVIPKSEPLYDPDDPDDLDRVPRWVQHPRFGSRVDVAVLPLSELDGVAVYPVEILDVGQSAVAVSVTSELSVTGFPFGLAHAGKLAIWTRATVATEFDVDYDGRPCFLIDARTREGQSGSPVLLFDDTGGVRFIDGALKVGTGPISRFMGIYSGRVNAESDLGFVWRPTAVSEVLAAAVS